MLYSSVIGCAVHPSKQESDMSKYEVMSQKSSHSFGVYEAETAELAIDACCVDAGYESKADYEATTDCDSSLIAVALGDGVESVIEDASAQEDEE